MIKFIQKLPVLLLLFCIGHTELRADAAYYRIYRGLRTDLETIKYKLLKFGLDHPEKPFINDSLASTYHKSLLLENLSRAFDSSIPEKQLYQQFHNEKKLHGIAVSYKTSSNLAATGYSEQITGIALRFNIIIHKTTQFSSIAFWLNSDQLKLVLTESELKVLNIICNSCPAAVEYERNETSFYYDYKDRIMRGRRRINIDSTELMKIAEVYHDWLSYVPDLHFNSVTDITHTGFYKDEALQKEMSLSDLEQEYFTRRFLVPAAARVAGIDSIMTEQIGFERYSDIAIHKNYVKLKYVSMEDDFPVNSGIRAFYMPVSSFKKELPEWVIFITERYLTADN